MKLILIKVVGVREALPCKEVQKAEIKCLFGAHVFLKCLLVLDPVLRMEIKFWILRFCRLDLTTGTNQSKAPLLVKNNTA